jgi:hypothetical protein
MVSSIQPSGRTPQTFCVHGELTALGRVAFSRRPASADRRDDRSAGR